MSKKDIVIEEATRRGDTIHIELWYPRLEEHASKIQVGLMDVRAADDIRVSYDFERDGWKIEQASTFEWDADDEVCDSDWQEVAFIQAWGRDRDNERSES